MSGGRIAHSSPKAYRTTETFDGLVSGMVTGLTAPDAYMQRLLGYRPFPVYEEFHSTDKLVKAIIGGNGSGKTMAAFVESLAVFTGIMPKSLEPLFPVGAIDWQVPRHVAVIVRDFKDHWNDVFKPLMFSPDIGMLPEQFQLLWNEEYHRIESPDGSTLVFMAMKSNEDSRQGRGSAKHWVHIDEECSEYTYNEMRARTMRREGRLVMSMCPQSGYTWAYDRIWLSTHDKEIGRAHV
jgi:hypothetical protein